MPQHLYAVEFNNGLIKVGRAADPVRRIQQHRGLLSVAGVIALQDHMKSCVGVAHVAEARVIARCAELATARRGNEWFVGLAFGDVTTWIDAACAEEGVSGAFRSGHMDKTEAIRLLGGTNAAAALAVGVTVQAVSSWPSPLPQRIADRVQAALWRIANGIPHPVPRERVEAQGVSA